ncbi:MAG TPA: ATP-binding protein [Gemmataceae bacterium]|nr:ATP-binding protein [Gemmataceae bacterium]
MMTNFNEGQPSLQQPEQRAEAFDDLGETLEELQTAEEELPRENEELASARLALKAERQRYRDLLKSVLRDRTEHTRAEQQAQDARAYAESIVQTVRHPLVVLDGGLRIKTANRSFYQTFQVLPADTENQFLYDLGNGQWNIPKLRTLLEEILPHRRSFEGFEVEHTFPAIGAKTMVLNACQLDQQGSVSPLLLLAIEDTTESEQLKRALRQRAEDLTQADRRKDEFLAMLGHELRNPLGAIGNAIAVLDRLGPHDAPAVRQRFTIGLQTRNLSRLVDDLLEVSRITSGKIVLRLLPVDLNEVARRCLLTLDAAVNAQHHQVSFSPCTQPVMVEGDPVRLEQVVTNLLANAVKYTPTGGRIEVAAQGQDNEGVVRVRDDGIGMAPEIIPHIFDLFTQAHSSLARSQGGLGIGLTLVRTLVHMHGGSVQASSPGPGRGSEFVVRLPLLTLPRLPTAAAPPPATEGPILTPARHILIVEDDASNRDTLRALLECDGHRVEVAEDGPQGVEKALALRPDVALVDIGLPGLDGYEVARRVRAAPGGTDILLIAVTGYGQPEDRRRTLEAGFDRHLVKPIDVDELQRLLADVKRSTA